MQEYAASHPKDNTVKLHLSERWLYEST